MSPLAVDTWRAPPLALLLGNPLLLWGLLLVAIPIAIHFLRRPTSRDEPWGAMQFLRKAVKKHSAQLQRDRWLQLILRILTLILLTLSLTDPYSPVESGIPLRTPIQYVLVWDCSLSMQTSVAGITAFERARQALITLVEQAPEGSSFLLLKSTQQGERVLISRPVYDPDAVQLELELLQPTLSPGLWETTCQEVLALLRQHAAERAEIVFVSDWQQTDWGATPAERERLRTLLKAIAERATVTVLDVSEPAENLFVSDMQFTPAVVTPGDITMLQVEVQHCGSPGGGGSITVFVDGVPYGNQPVQIPENGTQTLNFPLTLNEPGDHVVETRLSDDPLPEDNVRTAILPVSPPLRLLVLDTATPAARRPPRDYLGLVFEEDVPHLYQLNLVSSSGTRESSGQSLTTPATARDQYSNAETLPSLYGMDVVVASNPSATDISQLLNFVESGGGLVLALGPQSTNVTSTTSWSHELGLQLGPGSASREASVTLLPSLPQHPLIAPFAANPEAGLQTTRISQWISLQTTDSAWQTVVNTSTGEPVMLARDYGAGRIVLWTTPLDDGWGNWVLWPSFLPLMRESVAYVAAPQGARSSLILGEPWKSPVPHAPEATAAALEFSEELRPPVITTPDQRVNLAELNPEATHWEFPKTFTPGAYLAEAEGRTTRFSVNVDPLESDLRTLPKAEFLQLFRGIPHKTSVVTATETALTGSPASQNWSLTLLLLAGGSWLVELWWSHRKN